MYKIWVLVIYRFTHVQKKEKKSAIFIIGNVMIYFWLETSFLLKYR